MSKPLKKSISKTVFIVEGITTAVVVSIIGRRLQKSNIEFASPEAALAWCRKNRAGLVYSPASNPANN